MINHDEVEACEVCQVQHDCSEVSETEIGFICEPCQKTDIIELLDIIRAVTHYYNVDGISTEMCEASDLRALITEWAESKH